LVHRYEKDFALDKQKNSQNSRLGRYASAAVRNNNNFKQKGFAQE